MEEEEAERPGKRRHGFNLGLKCRIRGRSFPKVLASFSDVVMEQSCCLEFLSGSVPHWCSYWSYGMILLFLDWIAIFGILRENPDGSDLRFRVVVLRVHALRFLLESLLRRFVHGNPQTCFRPLTNLLTMITLLVVQAVTMLVFVTSLKQGIQPWQETYNQTKIRHFVAA